MLHMTVKSIALVMSAAVFGGMIGWLVTLQTGFKRGHLAPQGRGLSLCGH